MQNTYPVLVDPRPYQQTDVTSELVDRFDQAIFEISVAMAAAIALYRERQRSPSR